MRLKYLLAGLFALAIAIPSIASAQSQPPAQVPIQAYLTDSQGVPLDSSTTITAKIFSQKSGGSALYTEQLTVNPDAGSFTAYLGSTKSLDLNIFKNNQNLFLELQVGSETLNPRLRLATAPYAANAGFAQDAAKVGGKSASNLYSAGNGLSKSGTTFSVDTSAVQSRIGSNCSGGQFAVGVKQNGDLVCQTPSSMSISAGAGLNKSGNTISLASNGVKSSHIDNNTISQGDIGSNAVGTNEIANNSVTEDKLNYGCGSYVKLNNCGGLDVNGTPAMRKIPDCDEVPVGAVCEHDGGCGSLSDHNSCTSNGGQYELYLKVGD